MKQTVLKTTVAVLGAGLVSYLGTLAVPMLVLLGVMLLDYITGMIKALSLIHISEPTRRS